MRGGSGEEATSAEALSWLPSTRTVLVVFVGYLLLTVSLVLVVDIYDVAGLRATLGRDRGVMAWMVLFDEGSPMEWMQATALYGALACSAVVVGLSLRDGHRGWSGFAGVWSLALAVMLLEDTGNVGQRLANWAMEFTGRDAAIIPLVRLPVFLIAGALPLYAVWRYRRTLATAPRAVLGCLAAGYGAYGLVAATGEVLPLYPRFGRFLFETVFAGRARLISDLEQPQYADTTATETHSLFLDYVYEESLELLGATFLLCAAITLVTYIYHRHDVQAPPALAAEPDLSAAEQAGGESG